MAYNPNNNLFNDNSYQKNGKYQAEQKKKNEKAQEKKKTAVAISYNADEDAPKIIAAGKGLVAEKIIDTAKETNIPIHEDGQLAETLSRLDIGDYIPPELYGIVAEILLFVDKLDHIKEKVGVTSRADKKNL